MKQLLLFLLFISTGGLASAQEIEIPEADVLQEPEDYARYEGEVLRLIDWLWETPLNEQTARRKKVNAFVLAWMTGSPDVHLEIQEEVVTFLDTSPDLLMAFLCGWTRYAIETKNYDERILGCTAGIEAVIQMYNKNRKILPRDKSIEHYMKLQKKGELQAYLSGIM
jgi:hypothetical protein